MDYAAIMAGERMISTESRGHRPMVGTFSTSVAFLFRHGRLPIRCPLTPAPRGRRSPRSERHDSPGDHHGASFRRMEISRTATDHCALGTARYITKVLPRLYSPGWSIVVELFGQQGCPGTARARRYLAASRVPWKEYDIGNDPAARAQMRRYGAFATPLLLVAGKTVLYGFDAAELEAALRPEGLRHEG